VRKCDFTDDSTFMIGIDDFVDTITNRVKPDEIRKLVVEYGLTKDDTKFITSFNKDTYKFNTKRMNTILQEIFNPINLECGGGLYKEQNIPSNHKYDNGFMFRIGDKIIRTENDYSSEKMRANGEEATIKDFDGNIVTIQYSGPSDVPETIRSNELYENFLLNYCVTVHKSQGSQYLNVVYFIEPNQNIVDKKSIYTAISRAQKRCFVISNEIDFVNLQQTKKRVNMKATLYMEESNTYDI
jgi:ATP-dependent exoDNAse (exonuclease V) alpha subunit